MHAGRTNRPDKRKDQAMNGSLLQRVVRIVREMNDASRRLLELQAPWIG
jgi:hypothetical protein